MKPFCLAVFAVLLSSSLSAAPLAPGGVIAGVGTTFVDPVHGGTQIIRSDDLISFRLDPNPATLPNLGGNVQSRATEQTGTGNWVFAPRIRDTFNIEAGVFAIVAMSLTGYAGFDVDAAFRTDSLGDKGPTWFSRSADGDRITLRYTTGLDQGGLVIDSLAGGLREESLFPSLVTNANGFTKTGTATISGYLIDSSEYYASGRIIAEGDLLQVTIDGLAVPTTIPLPAPAALLLAGLAGLGAIRRRQR